MAEVSAALVGGVVGGVLALVTAMWSVRATRKFTEQEAARRELDALRGLIVEIDDAISIARDKSATPLPTTYLQDVMPLRFHMEQEHRKIVDSYSRAVLRYNGRVERLIAFGEGKRAAGESPGAEKVGSQHAAPVTASGAE